jgi:DNA-binding NarL/FixJ family response regulator
MGIRAFLTRHPNLQLLDEAKDGLEALQKTRELKPHIVLSDIDMPHLDGLALTEILRGELPEIKVVLLSGLSAPPLVKRILQSGARGFLSKQASSEELLTALETVASGDTFFSSDVARVVLNRLVGNEWLNPNASKLSQREQEVIVLIADGLSNKEIAARLEIGSRTVETHREHIMRKLNLHSTAGLTTYAVANGFVQLPAI